MARSIVEGVKSKNFTFRITEALANDIAEAQARAREYGLRVNMTKALTETLLREIKSLDKKVQLAIDARAKDSAKDGAKDNTE